MSRATINLFGYGAAVAAMSLLLANGSEWAVTSDPPTAPGFTDVTKDCGVADALVRHYAAHPKWWLSGLNLIDLDGDGNLDLFLAAHGAGRSLALLGDGQGRFSPAEGSYPPSEIHLPYDIDEDGRLDLGQPGNILRLSPPFGLRVPVQNSQAGARGIDQDPMEFHSFGNGQRLGRIPFHDSDNARPKAMAILPEELDFAAEEVQGENLPAVLHKLGQMGGFPPRGCASVQDSLSGLGAKEKSDHLGRFVLKPALRP